MQVDLYEYQTGQQHLDYEFYSAGPNGNIKKVVRFTLSRLNGVPYYNLGFGDWNDEKKTIDDFAATNNADVEKVLATVAAIVVDFTTRFPDAIIYAEGSTRARTRRYQMGINKLWDRIQDIYDVYGVNENDTIELFRKNVNYEAFLIKRK
jgi:hypothetical protein